MLSYRHAYHAGNHADVLKHLTLLAILQQLRIKDKPFVGLDTHCGNGFYNLGSDPARKTGEAAQGFLRLWQQRTKLQDTDLVGDYLALVAGLNPVDTGATIGNYPGSPAIMQSQLRDDDQLILMELHSTEIDHLRDNFKRDARISIHHRDGFEGAVALTPPMPRRGLLLMDPAYENKADYQQAIRTVQAVHRRWPTGIIALWYPMLGQSRDLSGLVKQKLGNVADSVSLELTVAPQSDEFGMHGSGMLILNPPWQLTERVNAALKKIGPLLQV
ncbi:MAG: 23S rRNA (adenine(2030)-N(6))-methyltransferase RlmJ [Gammaproteobacteria bacterium]|nr:23S rRNA (adenine(2030)-N(6))-methyltransferase RlmJ [Gammaproteobacteria bacterium]|tara:strand:+ start:3603 stop:4421 length:819 start_codon:yes stop_codon:yes gene_type:complete